MSVESLISMKLSGRDNLNQIKIKETQNRLFEFYIWCALSVICAGGIIFDTVVLGDSTFMSISSRYAELIISFFVFIFPLVFRLVFGSLPLEALRRSRAEKIAYASNKNNKINSGESVKNIDINSIESYFHRNHLSTSSSLDLAAYFLMNSRKLSQGIYGRSGLYLIVGVFIGFSGLAFFYSQTANLIIESNNEIKSLMALAPKFGILFFIEIVAFFFLRQYRSAMDEFRYYEAIKRNREESLMVLRLMIENDIKLSQSEISNLGIFSSSVGMIDKDKKSEIVETRKLEKNEIELLEKFLDVVSKSKR